MLRAVVAVVGLPGVVAGVIPLLLLFFGRRVPAYQSWLFAVPAAAGLLVLLSSVVAFYRRGSGTLAPWDPPQRLVVEDLYRFQRNPMYVGVVLILLGWAGLLGSGWHYVYAAAMGFVFHLRVVFYEEPEMERLFPQDWEDYRQQVPRWWIRWTPYQRKGGP